MQDEVASLTAKVEALEETRKDEGFDREKFYEGALWMSQQAVGECDTAIKQLNQLR